MGINDLNERLQWKEINKRQLSPIFAFSAVKLPQRALILQKDGQESQKIRERSSLRQGFYLQVNYLQVCRKGQEY